MGRGEGDGCAICFSLNWILFKGGALEVGREEGARVIRLCKDRQVEGRTGTQTQTDIVVIAPITSATKNPGPAFKHRNTRIPAATPPSPPHRSGRAFLSSKKINTPNLQALKNSNPVHSAIFKPSRIFWTRRMDAMRFRSSDASYLI